MKSTPAVDADGCEGWVWMRTLVVDGTYLLYRVWYTSGWALSDGEGLTGGAYGVLKTLHLALENVPDIDRVVVVWDGKRSERRKALYPEYKANRDASRGDDFSYADFELQRTLLEEVLPTLGVQSLRFEDREGDDVIYWVTRLAGEAVIVSEDKDMLLMLTPTVDVYRPAKDQYYTISSFTERNGYTPEAYLYERAIVGDSSDNIKGVKGAGEKTASAFAIDVSANGIEAAFANAQASSSKRTRAIAEQWDIVERNMLLMDCSNEIPTEDEYQAVQRLLVEPVHVNTEQFQAFCRRHMFVSMLNEGWLQPFYKVEHRSSNDR